MDSSNNTSNKKLLILLIVFIFAIISQATLNYSFSLANKKLDDNNKSIFTVGILGENIVRKLSSIQSLFYQLIATDSYKKRTVIQAKIQQKTKEVREYLNILENGGTFSDNIATNLPDIHITSGIYSIQGARNLYLIGIDIKPKLTSINQKVITLINFLNVLDDNQFNNEQFIQNTDNIRQFVKSTSPLFIRTIENANRIYYEFTQQKQVLEKEIAQQKKMYQLWQYILTISILLFGFIGFYVVGKQMRINNNKLQERKDYVHDVLESQSNIILVNDGKNIIDASGGFFTLFNNYKNLEEFTKDYDCICDTFVEEDGFLSKYIDDVFWVEYVTQHPEKEHKAKIYYNNTYYIYTVSCVKNEYYQRYIISMFNITNTEKIQKELNAQKNMAIQAVNSKNEFLANMSHEIRTPLNAILGFIELLKSKKMDTEAIEFVNTIESSGQSLLAVVNDVLDYSKIEDNKIIIDAIDFNSALEFKILVNLFTAQCREKNIGLQINFDKNIPNVINADILRIKQVVSNLLSNAIKFTPSNKNIYFSIFFTKNSLTFEVKDEGIGMSPEEQKFVFDKFSQAKSSTTREYGGTGLGLAISSRLVKLLGGELILESKENVGSTFSFTIPITVVQNDTTAKKTEYSGLFDGKVLLVEDNKTNQMLMSALLKKYGVVFDIANDGLEGVAMFKKESYDLILMDNNMPKMSGIQACETIRKYEVEHNLKQTIIVALTASTTTSEKEQFTAIGMNDYLSKPIEINKLLEIFNKFLKQV